MVILPEVLFSLRIFLTILSFLLFQMNFQNTLFNCMKNWAGILMGIALKLQIAYSMMTTFTVLILSVPEHGRPFHLLIHFFRDLKFFSYMDFTCLARVKLRYCILFMAIIKGISLNYFIAPLIICIKECYWLFLFNFVSRHLDEDVYQL